MTEKIKLATENIKNRIQWEQEDIDSYIKELRERAASATESDIITFFPSKINQIKEAIERKKSLMEQLQMLNFIQKED